ncbi:uncharacterized protein SCHCODRAFT_01192945 [Schizophyllum commune H4-8]|uniref:Expressed protein n=1 Tax=Schizophyllum commune (strain H4-8 / FGSC 9210) TaxID=578458 RepID=D8QGX0_SCHCM|nr:uncharacterized protein SCHCODRAFT_01192945 [Schizophyllum commune H4-8]KAI5886933.1 hypothetical protein SCHCODRAFT_01192945 [Schizophyllum commune H4-8]
MVDAFPTLAIHHDRQRSGTTPAAPRCLLAVSARNLNGDLHLALKHLRHPRTQTRRLSALATIPRLPRLRNRSSARIRMRQRSARVRRYLREGASRSERCWQRSSRISTTCWDDAPRNPAHF